MRQLPVIPLIPTAARPDAPGHPSVRARPAEGTIEIPPGVTLLHLAAEMPGGPGDTETQSRVALHAIAGRLARLGLGLGDLVRLQVALAPDPRRADTADRAGFEAAWHDTLGDAPPIRPLLSILHVMGLGAPDWLVAIEATAARPAPQAPHVHH